MIAVEIPKIVIKESNKEVPNKYRNAKFGSQMASGTSRCREIKKVIKGDDIYKKKCPTSWFPANISFNKPLTRSFRQKKRPTCMIHHPIGDGRAII